jgi:hypothetical protein
VQPIVYTGRIRDNPATPKAGCVGLFTVGELCRLNLGDHVNFDASAKWHLSHTDGAARMDASLTEYLDKELRRPIRNSVRLREVRCTVDHDKELYDSSNAAKITDGGFKHGQQFNCHVARGELASIQANLIVHLPAEELTALPRRPALVNGRHVLLPSTPSP